MIMWAKVFSIKNGSYSENWTEQRIYAKQRVPQSISELGSENIEEVDIN